MIDPRYKRLYYSSSGKETLEICSKPKSIPRPRKHRNATNAYVLYGEHAPIAKLDELELKI